MLKKSYITLFNLVILGLITFTLVKAAEVWIPSTLIDEKKLEVKNPIAKAEKTEVAKKVRLALSDYEIIEEQNLFHNTRKKPIEITPVPAPAADKAPASQPTPTPQPEIVNPPNIVFYGTSREKGDMFALIQGKSEQKPKKYRIKAEIDGYTIIEIKRSQITLSRRGKDFPIRLWDPNPAKKSAPIPNVPQFPVQQPVIQQPIPQQPAGITQPGAPQVPNRVNRGRPVPYPGALPGQQYPQPGNPGFVQPGQGYNVQQPVQEFEEDFQDVEEEEESADFQAPIPNLSAPNVASPNVVPLPAAPYPVPTPFIVPRYNNQ
jgi:hypothetical protein